MGEQQKNMNKNYKKKKTATKNSVIAEKQNKEEVDNGEEQVAKKSEAQESDNVMELKVDMHCACDGCADSIRKHIKKHLLGVERVTVHESNTKLKVKGNVDAWKLKELIEAKFRRDVTFVNPKNPPKKKEKAGGNEEKKPPADNKDGRKNTEEKKDNEPVECTIELKIRLHCKGCIDRIKRYIGKFKGVDQVTVEESKDLVRVKGTMEVKALVDTLKEKLKRNVEVVPQKKDEKKEKGGDKKQKDNNNGGENKDDGVETMMENSMFMPPMLVDMNRMDYYGGGGYLYQPNYPIVQPPAPQLFSDENPNACSIM